MSLLHKIRVLAGALIHKPFMPRPENQDLDADQDSPPGQGQASRRGDLAWRGGTSQKVDPTISDTERVADLLARRREKEGD